MLPLAPEVAVIVYCVPDPDTGLIGTEAIAQ